MSRALTPRTNLDTLRKDAKRWLRALRAGEAQARTRLRALWPDAPDEPRLRDIQHALALDYGQPSWLALKDAIDDMALARNSHAERVEQLLRHGWDGQPSAARRIVARYPEIACDSLFTAATCGDIAEVERRLARDSEGARRTGGSRAWTALAYTTFGRLDAVNATAIARLLLDAGADPNFGFKDDWDCAFTVLTGAVGLGEGAKPSHPQVLELVDLLIARGAEPYDEQVLYNVSIVGDGVEWYELFWRLCAGKDRLDHWRVAAEHRLGFGFGKNTLDYLLGNAVGQNHLARAEWLLARGADAGTTHAYTRQPLHAVAQLSGFVEMGRLLERHGAAPVALSGVQALQAACLRGDLAEARARVAAEPGLAREPAPLLAAATAGNAAAVAALLSLGADVSGLDADGIGPLHRAVQAGSPATVEALLAAGAAVDLRERKWKGTALSWSAVFGRSQIAQRLAPLSRDVRALASLAMVKRLAAVLDAEPWRADEVLDGVQAPTPLFCLPDDEDAAVGVARMLLAHGADPKRRDAKGRSAVDAARQRGLEDAAALMEGEDDA